MLKTLRAEEEGGRTKPISAKTRAADDKLREALRHFDLKTFDKALAKALVPADADSLRPLSRFACALLPRALRSRLRLPCSSECSDPACLHPRAACTAFRHYTSHETLERLQEDPELICGTAAAPGRDGEAVAKCAVRAL
jgi:hypothetical protein